MSTKLPSRKARREPVGRYPARRGVRANDWPDDDDVTPTDAGLCLDALEALGPVLIDRRGVALLLKEDDA